jgi:DNA repair exonuclease SbcCD ATPase subunit
LADTEALRKQLKDDAKTYADQRKRLADSQAEREKANTLTATLSQYSKDILRACPDWKANAIPQTYACSNINTEWTNLLGKITALVSKLQDCNSVISNSEKELAAYYQDSGKTEESLKTLVAQESQVAAARKLVSETDAQLKSRIDAITEAQRQIDSAYKELGISDRTELPDKQMLEEKRTSDSASRDVALSKNTQAKTQLDLHQKNIKRLKEIEAELETAKQRFARWDRLNSIFGGTRFRTLVQTYILRPLLNNANIYLEKITDRYRLTCSEANEQLSILVLDRYNKNQVRSVTVLSGGERFMISLALSLALSSLNRPDMNVNILFIDEGFGTLDENSLNSVMSTLEKLQEIAGQTNRRVGIISHREELEERIPVKIQVVKKGEGRSNVEISNT